MRMAGRMGGVRRTVRGLKVVKIDVEHNLIAVKGAVPGNKNSVVIIQSQQ
jgi:large subunit ribosomal protein L3